MKDSEEKILCPKCEYHEEYIDAKLLKFKTKPCDVCDTKKHPLRSAFLTKN